MTSLVGWDLAGSQVLSLKCGISFPHGGYRDDSWKCGCCYVLLYSCGDYQTLLTNLFLPSCILVLIECPGHSQCSCSCGLLRKMRQEHDVFTPSQSLVAAPTSELALPKEGKVRWLKTQSQISADPRRTGIKYQHVHSALQHCHSSATPSQILSTVQGTNNQIALTISSSTAAY